MEIHTTIELPSTEAELSLAMIWSKLLNADLSSIGLQTSFFELGGDSISGMQLVSRCRAQGWSLNSKSIFKLSTLKRIAASMTKNGINNHKENEIVVGDVPLTSIQRQFFGWDMSNIHHFNQSTLLIPSVELTINQVQQAINKLSVHHDMLRAVYHRNNNEWKQSVQDPKEFNYPTVQEYRVGTQQELEEYVQQSQKQLNIENGPLYLCSLIQYGNSQRLFLTIHHLVIDLVSWRVIYEDLEALFKGQELQPKSMSFKNWSELMQKEIGDNEMWNQHTVDVCNVVQNRYCVD